MTCPSIVIDQVRMIDCSKSNLPLAVPSFMLMYRLLQACKTWSSLDLGQQVEHPKPAQGMVCNLLYVLVTYPLPTADIPPF